MYKKNGGTNFYLEIPLEIQSKWRMNLFLICSLLALIGTISEIVIYLIDSSTKSLFLPNELYRLRFIYIPSMLNVIMIFITYKCICSEKLTNITKNRWSCALILFLFVNTQFIHYVYGPLLALPCLAIFVSVLFVDKKLTTCVAAISCFTAAASCVMASTELRKDDPQLLTDMGLAIVILFVSYIGARLLIKYVGQQINYILSISKRENELLKKLQIDNLIGIYNRNKMESVIEAFICADNTDKNGFYIVMLDLDDFKKINDTYGHLCGDLVLTRLADAIHQFGAKNIIPCRYGGEEIVIILKECDFEGAYDFANSLLVSFREQRFDFAPDRQITFSCGISRYESGMTRDNWIKVADDNLYQAKALGKNRIYPPLS